jgi:hypothetical protein
MLIESLGLALPDNARPDLSFTAQVPMEAFNPGGIWGHECPGEYYEVVTAVNWLPVTGAAAGVRTPVLLAEDASGYVILQVPSALLLGASGSYNLLWAIDVSALASSNNYAVMPWPTILLQPVMSLVAVLFGTQAGDALPAPVMTMLRIPTGPALPPASEPVLPVLI